MFHKKAVFKNLAIFIGKQENCVGVSFLMKIQAFSPLALLKRDSNKGAFLWNYEMFKNTCLEKHLWTAV